MPRKFNDTLPPWAQAPDFAFGTPKLAVGWFDISLRCLGQTHVFEVSYLCEAFSGFLSEMLDLQGYYEGRLALGGTTEPYASGLRWQGEPWRYEWTFWPRANREVNVRLVYHTDYLTREPGPDDQVTTWFEVCVPCAVLWRQWYEVGRAILKAYGLMGYREAWLASDFPLRDFRDLHTLVTGESILAGSVEDDIRFLARFAQGAACSGAPPATSGDQGASS